MVYRPTTHGILTPLPMVFWSPTHGTSTPYPWYFYPSTNGISNPLPMVFWPPAYLLIRNEGWSKYHGGSIYHTGGSKYHMTPSFLHSWTITGFVIRLTQRVPLVEEKQLTFPEHPSPVPVFSGVCVTQSLVLCVCFVDHCPFVLFCHCVVCPSIYGFVLPLSALVSWNSS